jgi:hypothetical protein
VDPIWHQYSHTELARDARSRPDGRRAGIRFLLVRRSSHVRSRLLDDFSRGDADHPARDTGELRRLSAPVLLARMAADIDAISNGPLVLGLGSGDMISNHL